LKHLITSEYKSYFKLAAVFFIGKVLTVYLLLLTKIDVYNLIIAYTICNLLEVCARSRLLRNPQRVKHITLLQRRSNRLSFPLFLFVGSVLIDRFIIEYLFTKEHFGIYNLLMMFVSAIVFVMSPLNQFLLNSNNLKMTQQRYIGWCFVLFSIIALIGLPLTHNIPLLADNYFGTISRDHIFFVLLFTAFFQVLTGLTMIKHQRNQNISFYRFLGIITAMLNFLLIPSLAHIYQLGGALIGACIVSFLILVLAQSYRST
jgi:O-antigen/teichoic acid export membrane protein